MNEKIGAIPRYPGLKIFSKGLQSIVRLTVSEHRDLMKVMVFVVDGLLSNNVSKVYVKWNEMYILSRLEIFKESDLEKFQNMINEWADLFIILFQKKLDSKIKFPKFYLWIFHIVDTIWEYRAINGYITETYESLHKSYVKTPYRLSNKKDVEKQIMQTLPDLTENMIKGFAKFLECLDSFFDMLEIISAEDYRIKIFAIAMDDVELFEYQSDNGICYAQTLLITEVILPNKSPFHLALVQWYNFKSKKTPFVYGCPLLKLVEIYNFIEIEAIEEIIIRLIHVITVLMDSRLTPHEPDSAIQYLGVWISEDGQKQEQNNKLRERVMTTTNVLKRKKLTDKQVRYIINQVLFPQIEYLLTDIVLGETIKNELNVSIKKCFKSVIGFSVALPDNVLHSHWGYRLFNIEDRQIQLHVTELMNRLNMNNKCGITTRMRLQDLQNNIWSTNSIWRIQSNTWKGISNRELNGEILELLVTNKIQIEITESHKFPIAPMGGNISIEEFIQSVSWYKDNREACKKHKIRQGRPINPFNRIIKLDQEQIKKDQIVAIKTNANTLIGRVYRNPRENISTIPIYHYISDPMDGIEGSPVAPCEGCDLIRHKPDTNTQMANNSSSKKCVIEVEMDIPIIEVPHCNKNDKRARNRLLLSPLSINTFIQTSNQPERPISSSEIKVYTDGSMTKLKQKIPGETFGKKISGRVEGPPSSTRAELWAILVTIYIIPSKIKIQIYTDSSSAIWAIRGFLENKKGKSWSNYKSPTVLQAIVEIIKAKQIELDLIKVEAHSGIVLNKRADKLAQKGLTLSGIYEIDIMQLNDRKALFKWSGKHIDTSIKKFIKKRTEVKWITQWRIQYRTYKWINENIANDTDWQSTWKLIHDTKIVSNYTSKEDQKYRTFNIKILNDELPVINNLHIRKPSVYQNDKCIFCKARKEDATHVFLCKNKTKLTQEKFKNYLLDAILEIQGRDTAEKTKIDIINASYFNIDEIRQIRETDNEDEFSLVDCIRGLVPSKIRAILRENIKDTIKVKSIIKEWYMRCRKHLFIMWTERCARVLEWEKSIGIGRKEKRGKGTLMAVYDNILEWEKSLGIRRKEKRGKGGNSGLKDPDYRVIKDNLEQCKESIIKQTLMAVYDNNG
ncbi:hypothetical protein Glove_327g14 [Diversispora epigaea]|uniref:ribonuclease H n=1 Tax=Diversispora epigaea TaxID=1348612 RepID=A0A397HTH4_9GLOM|nr:hypothetical protein Glove_327g14 [Diversispora epigaea]